MSDARRRMSALGGCQAMVRPGATKSTVVLAERAFLGHLNLRGSPADNGFIEGTHRCLGIPLPLIPNRVHGNERVTALWLGPDEWLILTPPSAEAGLSAALRTALQGRFCSVSDITDGQAVIRISGSHAVDVLQKGCGLDLYRTAFPPGGCAQTLVAKAHVLIHCVDSLPSFDLIVRRSFADYLACWLDDAAIEYRCA